MPDVLAPDALPVDVDAEGDVDAAGDADVDADDVAFPEQDDIAARHLGRRHQFGESRLLAHVHALAGPDR